MRFYYNNKSIPLLLVPLWLVWLNVSVILHWGATIAEWFMSGCHSLNDKDDSWSK